MDLWIRKIIQQNAIEKHQGLTTALIYVYQSLKEGLQALEPLGKTYHN